MQRSCTMTFRKLSSTIKLGVALVVSVFSSGIMTPATAFADSDPKVFVCKYVGSPGVNEVLKEGKNPISVNSNATIGTSFNDGQERSYVLSLDTTAPGPEDDPDVISCPAPTVSTQEVITTPMVDQEVVCGADNDTYSVADGDTYDVLDNQDGTFTLTAIAGHVFADNELTTLTLTAPEDQNTPCGDEISISIPTPTVDQGVVCGPNNDTYSVSTHPNYTVVDNEDGTFTLSAAPGYTFTTTGTNTAVLTSQLDTDTDCPDDTEEKYSICHATGNDNSDKYVLIEKISASGIYHGHMGENHQNGDDIIPPFTYRGAEYRQNWDSAGMAIYDRGCKTTPTVTPAAVSDIDFSLLCVKNGVKVTLTNSSKTAGNAVVNGINYSVAGNSTRDVCLSYDAATPYKTHVTVTIGFTTSTQMVNCTPGRGSGVTLGTNTTSSLLKQENTIGAQVLGASDSPALPGRIPATGGTGGGNPFLIIIASLVAYGATYFLQGRRQLNANLEA